MHGFSLRILLKLSKQLKARRVGLGALVLASSEVRFNVDSETADPIDVKVVIEKIYERIIYMKPF